MDKIESKLHVVRVTTKGNLNNYKSQGIFYFSGEYTPTGIPAGTNGWLIVLPNALDSAVKQIWMRHGTPNTNDHETYVRTYTGSSWSAWKRYTTMGEFPIIQNGRVTVTTSAGKVVSKAVKFPKPFSNPPIVTVCAASTSPGMQLMGVSAAEVTEKGFNVYVNRTTSQDTTIMWNAMEEV